MWWLHICGMMLTVTAARETYERIGYFWHITDIHYNPHFHMDTRRGCGRPEYEGGSVQRDTQRRPLGRFGDYSCDAPWELIESAARTMMSRQNDNVEFVLWTGDGLSHAARRLPEERQLELLQNLTDLLGKTFTSQFVFPALGHEDPSARTDLGKMWSRWLPTDSMNTFETGGYYMIERKMLKPQIVVLNTNLMKKSDGDEDAKRQWKWLDGILDKFQRIEETVYIVGHMPPGSHERQRGGVPPNAYSGHHNRKYLTIVRKYANIIAGQFFGHLHSDTFRVMYSDIDGRPISWAMVSPAITPRRTAGGANNPGLRIYKFNKDTGQVLDYTQYYLDLSHANSVKGEAEWVVEYNFSSYYGINEINAFSLHQLADKLTFNSPSNDFFTRYYRANSVRMYSNPAQAGCDANCAHTHYCAITRVDYQEFEHCLKTAASALASSTSTLSAPLSSLLLVLLLPIIVIYKV